MRTVFIVMRLLGYGCLIAFVYLHAGLRIEWESAVSAAISLWCIWDHWKKPDAAVNIIRLGIAVEAALILTWVFVVRDVVVLFALLSPLARSCIHLNWRDNILILLAEIAGVGIVCDYLHADPTVLLVVLPAAGGYVFVVGALLKRREQAHRLLAVSAFERELYAQDEERVRIAGQLHDRTGQYWVAITRALDVAKRVEGEQRLQFIDKARQASLEGLEEMRTAVGRWNDGLQTPEDWMRLMERSVRRFGEIAGIPIALNISSIPWHRLEHSAEVAETIARTTIESMTNAVRHGKAGAIVVRVEAGIEGIHVIVQDDGEGFGANGNATSAAAMGTGIRTMIEQAHTFGGSFSIEAGLERGTTVSLRFPYHTEMKEIAE